MDGRVGQGGSIGKESLVVVSDHRGGQEGESTRDGVPGTDTTKEFGCCESRDGVGNEINIGSVGGRDLS